MKKLLYIFLFLSVVLTACNSDKPDIISAGKMEDILYDFHLAQNMNGQGTADERALVEIRNREAILQKYGVTDEEWDSSYNYYCRHSQELYNIYKNLSERVRNELTAMGGSVSTMDNGLTGDTANVWNTDHDFILMQQTPYNVKTFDVVADSTYKAGDRLTLQFNSQYIFQDGMRDLVITLAITLGNDSVMTETRHVSMDGLTSICLTDTKKLGIKEIRGYFLLSRNINDIPSTTLRLASVSNVALVRMHDNKPAVDESQPKPDSANVQHVDSLHLNSNSPEGSQPQPATPVDGSTNHPAPNGVLPGPPTRSLRPAAQR